MAGWGNPAHLSWRIPLRCGVNFDEWMPGGEQLGDDLSSLDDELARRLAVLFLAQGTQVGDGSFGQHRVELGARAARWQFSPHDCHCFVFASEGRACHNLGHTSLPP